MNESISELVKLPDPAIQPLVHPLDLPEARRLFLRMWLLKVVTSPRIALCVAGLVWFASQSYLAPLIAGGVLITIGIVLGQHLSECAWEYIPRRRQDRSRPLPVWWELCSSLLFAVLLAAVVLLVAMRLAQPDLIPEVRAVILGMGAALGLLVLIEFAAKIVRQRGPRRREAWFSLPTVVVVLAGLVVAYYLFFPATSLPSTEWVLFGVVLMLVMGGLTGILRRAGLVQ